jgi:2-polyprenyl-6-methoxyphenol hydroxylase-like FAD-dependent oxidoreductase
VPDTDIDVLIVGAGPVGLFLANECARRNLRWRLVEARSTQSVESRALAVFPRSLEVLDMAGLVGPFLDAANRVNSVAVMTRSRTLARIRFAPPESPYPFIAMIPQSVTERTLADSLRARGGTVEYDTSFVSAVQSDSCVTATLNSDGKTKTVTAAFVVGCDGAHSVVRQLLDLPFEGGDYAQSFLLADIDSNEALPANQLQLCPSEFGPVAIFPMGRTRRRVMAIVDRREGDTPSLELVQRLLRQRAPAGIEARAIHWTSYFHVHHRHTARLRVGRIFIAGDAAHIHSPFGGQGMNTGLQDAWNLVWKLDLAVNRRGTEKLLDSYTLERLPVIRRVIRITDLLTKMLGTPNRLAQTLRNTALPMVSRLPSFQRAFVQTLSGLGVAYPGSPVVEGNGKRYFDDSMRGGEGVRSRFLLFCDDADRGVEEAAIRVAVSLGDFVDLRLRRGSRVMLVRPDGYVAYLGKGRDALAALANVRWLLESQISGAENVTSIGRRASMHGGSRPAA